MSGDGAWTVRQSDLERLQEAIDKGFPTTIILIRARALVNNAEDVQ